MAVSGESRGNYGLGTSGWEKTGCHQIEHEPGGMFDIAHGAGLAAVWGSWARCVLDANANRFEKFAVDVMEVKKEKNHETAALRDQCRRLLIAYSRDRMFPLTRRNSCTKIRQSINLLKLKSSIREFSIILIPRQ